MPNLPFHFDCIHFDKDPKVVHTYQITYDETKNPYPYILECTKDFNAQITEWDLVGKHDSILAAANALCTYLWLQERKEGMYKYMEPPYFKYQIIMDTMFDKDKDFVNIIGNKLKYNEPNPYQPQKHAEIEILFSNLL